MPWLGIEDANIAVTCVWLSRTDDSSPWTPLRKADCRALNEACANPEKPKKVYIESGRATADIDNCTITNNFSRNAPIRKLHYGTWFDRDKKNALQPIVMEDAEKIEALYQKALTATSSLGDGRQSVQAEEVILSESNGKFKAMVTFSGDTMSIRRRPVSKLEAMVPFSENVLLQRGYGEYTVDGEVEELSLAPVQNLVFVVHGVGEAMWSRSDVNLLSFDEQINNLRKDICKRQYHAWKKACHKADKSGEPEPAPPHRIEFLPIEWYEQIHSSSTKVQKSLKSVTLKTVPLMRGIANDVVFDVLTYLTPEFSAVTLEFVTKGINSRLDLFMEIHPDFCLSSDKVSLIGHSLGSVIVWDLLCILKTNMEEKKDDNASKRKLSHYNMCGVASLFSYGDSEDEINKDEADNDVTRKGSWGPTLLKPMTDTIRFVPDFVFFLGSPLGLFLTLRGAHGTFDQMRKMKTIEDEPEQYMDTSPFTLPGSSIYNIFHPSDPVAYRIEPLLLPFDLPENAIPPPCFLATEEGGIRFHIQVQQFGTNLTKKFAKHDDLTRSLSNLKNGSIVFPLGGKSGRVDFQLQQGLIGNDYMSALVSHTSYFVNDDVIGFIMEVTSTDEENAKDEENEKDDENADSKPE